MNHGYEVDGRFASSSAGLAERIAASSRTAEELRVLIIDVDQLVAEAKPGVPRDRWSRWLSAAHYLLASNALSSAVQTGAGVADAKARFDILKGRLAADCPVSQGGVHEEQLVLDDMAIAVLKSPLPMLYWCRDRRYAHFAKMQATKSALTEPSTSEPLPSVARLIVNIDHSPLVSPQEVRPGTLYRLHLESHLATWPERMQEISYRFVTTLANTQYSISDIKSTKSFKDGRHVATGSATLAFPYAQNDPFMPIVFAISALTTIEGKEVPIRIVGHDQLMFRVREDARTLLSSGWPRMDSHLHDLVQLLCSRQPSVHDELSVLLPLLEALTSVLGTYAQGGILKGVTSISESEFQLEVLKLLRMRLGQDVQEGPKQSGGITDIRYRGCIVELKVESVISDREKVFQKYASQTAQYQSVEARSVSILLVLDLTEKVTPPGDLRNDIMLNAVKTHGGDGQYPSWTFMFVVRGNVRSPSSYSS